MKKVFNSLFVIIAAMVTFAGCQKEENNAPAAQTKTVEFFANSIETKTVFGESYTEGTDTKYPTLWSAGDKVKVYLNLSIPSGTSGTEKSPTVELLEGTETSASAKFKAEIVDYFPESYTFYAVSPSDAANARTSSRLTVLIPTLQKPLATSPAKDAQIVYAISETREEMPSSIDMDFHHFTAYGKLSFSNLASTSVSKVKIVAPADVCLSGKWNYLPADGTLAPHSEGTSNEITIETTSTSDIWFACGPVDVSSKTLKFIVTTDDGNLEKEITFPANRKFQSGKVAKFTVDMDGVTVPEPEETTVTLTKVTDVSQFTAGTYIIVSEDEKYYLPNVATSSAPSAKSVTKVNGVIQLSDDMLWDTKSSGNGLIFESSAVSGRYLVATKADNNAIQVNTTSDVVWTASTVSGHGVVMLSSKATDRYLSMYKTQDWRYYKSSNIPGSTSNQYANLYKVQDADTPGQPDAPATPVLSVTATEVNVDAAAGNGDIIYSVENSISGTTVSASTTATWITNFSYTTAGKVTFSVSANTGAERSAVVTLTYPGAAESKNVTVKQAAGQSGGEQVSKSYVEMFSTYSDAGNSNTKSVTIAGDACSWTGVGVTTAYWSNFSWGSYNKGVTFLKPGSADAVYLVSETLSGGITNLSIAAAANATNAKIKVSVINVDNNNAETVLGTVNITSKKTKFTGSWEVTGVSGNYQIKIYNNATAGYVNVTDVQWNNN